MILDANSERRQAYQGIGEKIFNRACAKEVQRRNATARVAVVLSGRATDC
jgi:hypothetical protein